MWTPSSQGPRLVWFVQKGGQFWKESNNNIIIIIIIFVCMYKNNEKKQKKQTKCVFTEMGRLKEALCVDIALNCESEPVLHLLLLTLNPSHPRRLLSPENPSPPPPPPPAVAPIWSEAPRRGNLNTPSVSGRKPVLISLDKDGKAICSSCIMYVCIYSL